MVCFGHSLVVFDFSYGLTQDCRLVCQNVWTPCVMNISKSSQVFTIIINKAFGLGLCFAFRASVLL